MEFNFDSQDNINTTRLLPSKSSTMRLSCGSLMSAQRYVGGNWVVSLTISRSKKAFQEAPFISRGCSFFNPLLY